MQNKKTQAIKVQGFTIIELMMALLIAGVLMSYALPSYRQFGLRQKVTNEANSLLGDLMYARATAIKEGQSVSVDTVSGDDDWAEGWTITLVNDGVLLRQMDLINQSIKLKGANNSVVFNNFGAASTVNTIVISHADAQKEVTLSVAASGMVTTRDKQ